MSRAEPPIEGAVALIRVSAASAQLGALRAAVLHRAAGRTLLAWVATAARAAGCDRLVVLAAEGVVSADQRAALLDRERELAGVEWLEDRDPTTLLPRVAETLADPATPCLLLAAEAPAVEVGLLRRMIERARQAADGAVHLGESSDPTVVALPGARLGELAAGAVGVAFEPPLPGHANGLLRVSDPVELSRVEAILRGRLIVGLQRRGVTVVDPARLVVEADVEVAPDAVLHPDVALLEGSSVGSGCVLHQGAWLRASRLGEDVEVLPYSVLDGARVGGGCTVGPFARLRPGTVLGKGARIGNFVEVKASTLGDGSKANHLAYIGDAEVGERVNIGAGAVTCNYDGVQKHRTRIGDDAFVGSDTMLVAPVRVGAGALTAAGSVISQDVPDDALGVGRARQRNIEGWAKRNGPRARKRALQEAAKRESDPGSE